MEDGRWKMEEGPLACSLLDGGVNGSQDLVSGIWYLDLSEQQGSCGSFLTGTPHSPRTHR